MISSSNLENRINKELLWWVNENKSDPSDFKRGAIQFGARVRAIIEDEKKHSRLDYRELGAKRAYSIITTAHAFYRAGQKAECFHVLEKTVAFIKQKEKSLH